MTSKEEPSGGDPSDHLTYILRELVELKTSISMLEARALAHSHALDALMVALPVNERTAALSLLRAQQQLLAADDEDAAALFLEDLIRGMQGLLGDGEGRTIGELAAAVGLNNALMQTVGPEHLKPMRTWLTLATEDEIAQDALQLPREQLAALLRLQSASSPAPKVDDRPKKRGGAPRKKKPNGD